MSEDLRENAAADRHKLYQRIDKVNSKEQALKAKKEAEAKQAATQGKKLESVVDKIDNYATAYELDNRQAEFEEIYNSQPANEAEQRELKVEFGGNRPKWILAKLDRLAKRVNIPVSYNGMVGDDEDTPEEIEQTNKDIEDSWQKRSDMGGGRSIQYQPVDPSDEAPGSGANPKSAARITRTLKYLRRHAQLTPDELVAFVYRAGLGAYASDLGFDRLSTNPTDEEVWQIMRRGKTRQYRDGMLQGVYLAARHKIDNTMSKTEQARIMKMLTERVVTLKRDFIMEAAGMMTIIQAGTKLVVFSESMP